MDIFHVFTSFSGHDGQHLIYRAFNVVVHDNVFVFRRLRILPVRALQTLRLVNVIARRARQLSIESEITHEPLTDKPVTIAIREVAEGKLVAALKDKYEH